MVRTDFWNNEDLLKEFEEVMVSPILSTCMSIEEEEAGVPIEEIEDAIWKSYPKWAEKRWKDEEDYHAERINE